MTTVNWEREPGEKIEEFVAAMLLLDNPHGNRITPSKGDKGVDVRIYHPDGWDIYQIKRYSRPLTSKQRSEIENSWNTFIEKTLPVLPIRSWTLVMPWNPTNDRLAWLDQLTQGSGVPHRWLGRDQLDGMASGHPALVDYYFGDGGRRIQDLMASALAGGKEVIPGEPAEALLGAVVARQHSLVTALNQVDPFYRYEVEIRADRLSDLPPLIDVKPGVAMVKYAELDQNHYAVLRLFPRSASSHSFRPIQFSLQFEVAPGSPEQDALTEFFQFGAPFESVKGTVVAASGPPGTVTTGPGVITFFPTEQRDSLPDLEVRLRNAEGPTIRALDLVDIKVSHATDGGPGYWIAGRDPADVLRFQFLLNGPNGENELRLSSDQIDGKTPASILPAVRLVAAADTGTCLELAIRDGKSLISAWEVEDSQWAEIGAFYVKLAEALVAIQGHTYSRIVMPDVDRTPPTQLSRIIRIGRLLRGEHIEERWTAVSMVRAANDLPGPEHEEFALMLVQPLAIELNGETIELDMDRRTVYASARLEDRLKAEQAVEGDTIRLIPGSDPRAVTSAVPRAEIGGGQG